MQKPESSLFSRLSRRTSPLFRGPHGLLLSLLVLAVAIGFLTRGVLLVKAGETVSVNLGLLGVFLMGLVFDAAAALFWLAPVAVLLACLPRVLRRPPSGAVLAYVLVAVASYALFFGCVSEYLFWDEFGVRFNFIAVDYLVYTHEVIGNIRESYPMPLIFAGLGLGTVLVLALVWRAGLLRPALEAPEVGFRRRWRVAGVWTLAAVAAGVCLNQDYIPSFGNTYNRELAKDGLWSLFAAFRANQLDYEHFYQTMPQDAALARVKQQLPGSSRAGTPPTDRDLLRNVTSAGPEQRLNVIQITVESLSGEFLARYGNTEKITPNLDALIPQSLVFDRFYATGTRTDRGMEALTLSVPPTPGRSLVKRPENAGLFSLGSVLAGRGYQNSFIYSGYGYFDNMNAFFGGNGYRVLDRTMVSQQDITFANVWGACDEDLLRWTLRQADEDAAQGRPFFHFVMTTSNHRPFTFPDGRIDLPSKVSGRQGGVKYTDFAIGQFLREASGHAWYKNTVFVIVADHCASSAGRTELPVNNYHIPLIIFAPGGQVKPGKVETLCSQIDYAPTLLGLLGMSYPSRFFGVDVLHPPAGWQGRALIGNYQKLGLYTEGHLSVLSPVRHWSEYSYDESTRDQRLLSGRSPQVDETIALYQTACWLFAQHKQLAFVSDGGASNLAGTPSKPVMLSGAGSH